MPVLDVEITCLERLLIRWIHELEEGPVVGCGTIVNNQECFSDQAWEVTNTKHSRGAAFATDAQDGG